MKVKDLIEFLKTQDPDRTVEVLQKEPQKPFEFNENYEWATFDPTLHSSTFFEGTLQIGSDD